MNMLLVEHYGQRAERYRSAAQGYVDDKLKEIFPACRGRQVGPVSEFLRKNRSQLLLHMSRWSGLEEEEIGTLLDKLEDRAEVLDLSFNPRQATLKLVETTALVTSLAMNFAYTGRLTG
jgi:hypothetical protein